MFNADRSQSKIVHYLQLILKQEICRDINDKPIYRGGKYALHLAENKNGDICASDRNADCVVVVTKSGNVLLRYDGREARRKGLFDPWHLVTDAIGEIIVADSNNECLHILDQRGQFIRCLDNVEIDIPTALGMDREGNL
jgi:hypothetical protein